MIERGAENFGAMLEEERQVVICGLIGRLPEHGEGRGEGADFRMIEAKKFLRGWHWRQYGRMSKQGNAVAEEKGFAEIVGDEDDSFAEAAGEGAEFALKLGAGDGIEGAEGLVHQKNRRIGGKGTSDADTLALAAGEFARAAAGKFSRIKSDEAEQLIDAGSDSAAESHFSSEGTRATFSRR